MAAGVFTGGTALTNLEHPSNPLTVTRQARRSEPKPSATGHPRLFERASVLSHRATGDADQAPSDGGRRNAVVDGEEFPYWLKARLRRAARPGLALRAPRWGPPRSGASRLRAPPPLRTPGTPGRAQRRGTPIQSGCPFGSAHITIYCAGDGRGDPVDACRKPQPSPTQRPDSSDPSTWHPHPHRSGPPTSGNVSGQCADPAVRAAGQARVPLAIARVRNPPRAPNGGGARSYPARRDSPRRQPGGAAKAPSRPDRRATPAATGSKQPQPGRLGARFIRTASPPCQRRPWRRP